MLWLGFAMKVLVVQSCLTLCDPMDCSLPDSSVHGLLQAIILEWVAMPFSSGSSWLRNRTRVPTLRADSLQSELPGKNHVNKIIKSKYLCSVSDPRGKTFSFSLLSVCYLCVCHQFSSVAQLCLTLRHHELQHVRPPCPSPILRVYSNSCPSSWWCHPVISSSVVPFSSWPQTLPESGSFPMSQLFAWGGQDIGISASASGLPMNTQDWPPLGWTGWISLQSKGLSRVFSNITVQKHQFFSTQLSSQSNSHIHTWPLEKP